MNWRLKALCRYRLLRAELRRLLAPPSTTPGPRLTAWDLRRLVVFDARMRTNHNDGS